MTKREVVQAVVEGRSAPEVPYSFDLTQVAQEKLAACIGTSADRVHEAIGDYLKYLYCDIETQPIGEELYKDEFGVVWKRGDSVKSMGDWGGIHAHPILEAGQEYHFPNPASPNRFLSVIAEAAASPHRYHALHLDGLLDLAWHARGFEDFMEDLILEPRLARQLLDNALAYNLGIIEAAPPCVDGIRFGEDWGQQKGLFMGTSLWRSFLKPRLQQMYAATRKKGMQVLIHSCGDIAEIFPDIIELGVQAVHPIQPEVMDIAFLKKEYGRDITLYGGLGCQSTIPLGSVAQVLDEAKRHYELLSKGGRYIFGPAGAIPTETPAQNIYALCQFAQNGYQ